jgi:hypothetical protein
VVSSTIDNFMCVNTIIPVGKYWNKLWKKMSVSRKMISSKVRRKLFLHLRFPTLHECNSFSWDDVRPFPHFITWITVRIWIKFSIF